MSRSFGRSSAGEPHARDWWGAAATGWIRQRRVPPVIQIIRQLSPQGQRQLIKLLDPRMDLDETGDDELLGKLVLVLRRVLEVPAKDDLPEYLRRRLADIVRHQFELMEDVDTLTDMELAHVLVDFTLEAAERLAEDDEGSEEFATFLRTKDRTDRTRWLVESQRVASLVTSGSFDRVAAERRADELYAEQSAHSKTAKAIIGDLGAAAATASAAASRSGRLAAVVSASATGSALAPAVAVPLGALAGGLFMAGRRRQDLVRVAGEEAKKTRAQRARRSRQVQSMVGLCAFLVAQQAGGEPGSRRRGVKRR